MEKSDRCTEDLQVGGNNFKKVGISFETEILKHRH